MLDNMFKYTYVCMCVLNCIRLFATLWTVAHQTLLSMGSG